MRSTDTIFVRSSSLRTTRILNQMTLNVHSEAPEAGANTIKRNVLTSKSEIETKRRKVHAQRLEMNDIYKRFFDFINKIISQFRRLEKEFDPLSWNLSNGRKSTANTTEEN